MSRRPQALDNLVFGLAAFLFCVLGYYAFRQVQQRRQAQQVALSRAADARPSLAAAGEASNLPPLAMSGAQEAVTAVPAVASGVVPARSRRR